VVIGLYLEFFTVIHMRKIPMVSNRVMNMLKTVYVLNIAVSYCTLHRILPKTLNIVDDPELGSISDFWESCLQASLTFYKQRTLVGLPVYDLYQAYRHIIYIEK